MNQTMKKRLFYLLLTFVFIVIALTVREIWAYLPDFINIWLGDYLWDVMLFWACMVLFLHTNRLKIALSLVVFCWCVEASQAFHTPWLDAFRNTTFGGLLLGHGFLWSDIIAYTAGVVTAYFVDKRFWDPSV
jgi:hypothetical protein